VGKVSEFMSQPEEERDYDKMMGELDVVGDFTQEENKRVKQLLGIDVQDLDKKFNSGSLDYVTLMKKFNFDGQSKSSAADSSSGSKSFDPEPSYGSNKEEEIELDDPEMDEWLNRDFEDKETDPKELVKNHNIPFPSHDPDYNATPKFQKTVEDFKVVSDLLKMNPLPGTKSQLPDDAKLREKGKNVMALEGMGGFNKTDGSAIGNSGSGRGRGGRVGGVFDGADKRSEGFGDLADSSCSSNLEDYKDIPTAFFEDASQEANDSILRLLHNVHASQGPEGIARGIRRAQNAMTPVRPNFPEDHPHYDKVAEMCATMEKNAHLDAEYKKDLVRMFEEAIENEDLEDDVDEFGQMPYDGPIPTPKTDAKGRVGKMRET